MMGYIEMQVVSVTKIVDKNEFFEIKWKKM